MEGVYVREFEGVGEALCGQGKFFSSRSRGVSDACEVKNKSKRGPFPRAVREACEYEGKDISLWDFEGGGEGVRGRKGEGKHTFFTRVRRGWARACEGDGEGSAIFFGILQGVKGACKGGASGKDNFIREFQGDGDGMRRRGGV